jgi:hypothetical protein
MEAQRQNDDFGQMNGHRSALLALTLLAKLLQEDPDAGDGGVARRLSGQLRLCADLPELAALALGCDSDLIDPELLRRAAQILTRPAEAAAVLDAA